MQRPHTCTEPLPNVHTHTRSHCPTPTHIHGAIAQRPHTYMEPLPSGVGFVRRRRARRWRRWEPQPASARAQHPHSSALRGLTAFRPACPLRYSPGGPVPRAGDTQAVRWVSSKPLTAPQAIARRRTCSCRGGPAATVQQSSSTVAPAPPPPPPLSAFAGAKSRQWTVPSASSPRVSLVDESREGAYNAPVARCRAAPSRPCDVPGTCENALK